MLSYYYSDNLLWELIIDDINKFMFDIFVTGDTYYVESENYYFDSFIEKLSTVV